MKTETRNCQNCKTDFVIEPEDFKFYEKIKVPPPTFCPQCRFQRRLMFFNQRSLYKRKCDLCGRDIISTHSSDKPFTVYCPPCWWSDKWNGDEYASEYDSSRPFLEQVKDLAKKTPHLALNVDYATNINCDYLNHAGHCKNCYLIYIADFCENVLYSEMLGYNKDSMDCTMLGGSELCYGDISCGQCYNTFFSEDCRYCRDVYFSKSCVGCSNCFGCINLRKKDYHIFNKPYSKEEYEKKIESFRLHTYSAIQDLKREVYGFWTEHPQEFMRTNGTRNVNVSGDYVFESKNAKNVWRVWGVEDSKYCQIVTLKPVRDTYDYTSWGNNVTQVYESTVVGEGASLVKFSVDCWPSVSDVEYSMWVISSQHMFGCVNMKKQQYCILNKQYSPSDFEALKLKIIEDMKAKPFIDSRGIKYSYGEFFPPELSYFAYNETTAMDYFSITESQAKEKGYAWHKGEPSQYKVTLTSVQLPDSIRDAQDSILGEVLECSNCKKAFKLVKPELDLLRRFDLPIPRECPNCRYEERLGRVNPPRLWDRKCEKCGKDIQTSYAPERPEIVYCEECYQKEVI